MIYLDAAATTFQKPETVARAMVEALHTMSSIGRGGYEAAVKAAETVFACREALAALFSVSDSSRVVFTMNATHALNLAIKTLVPPGGRAVISGYEHNAVTRPLQALGAEVDIAAAPLFSPEEMIDAFSRRIDSGVDAVIYTHVSNVFGCILPVEDIAALCRERSVPFILDASQSAGVLPINMEDLQAAFIAMPGHKGLYGPQGTGVLLCGSQCRPKTLLEGGTGSLSALQEMPEFLPDRLESGTHNVPGIAGLLAGVQYVQSRGCEAICRRERTLTHLAARELMEMKGVTVYSRPGLSGQSGVLSFQVEGKDSETVGEALARKGFALRAGLHCAPLAHRSGGTIEQGTVRLSPSDFNTEGEIGAFLEAVAQIKTG